MVKSSPRILSSLIGILTTLTALKEFDLFSPSFLTSSLSSVALVDEEPPHENTENAMNRMKKE